MNAANDRARLQPENGWVVTAPTRRGSELFASLTAEFLERAGTSQSSMMGFPCLRRDGAFFASLEPKTESLILKLPAERVIQLLASEVGHPFAPNGRRFREWITLAEADQSTWPPLVEEAWHFASNASRT